MTMAPNVAKSMPVVVLALLVVLAGCGGSPSPSEATSESPTRETSPSDGGRSPTGSPPGTATSTAASTAAETGTAAPPNTSARATFLVDGDPATTVTLEVADTDEERRRGLMNRTSLPKNHGMVFVYEDAAQRTFWMKNTKISLDIVFVAANGTVLNVAHADPQPNASDAELRRYSSDGPAKYVVEVNQGFANRTGVEAGTEVRFDWNETASG